MVAKGHFGEARGFDWRGGGFCGLSLLSSLIEWLVGEGNDFFRSRQGQI